MNAELEYEKNDRNLKELGRSCLMSEQTELCKWNGMNYVCCLVICGVYVSIKFLAAIGLP